MAKLTSRAIRTSAAAVLLAGTLAVLLTGLFVPGWMVGGVERSKPLPPLPAAPVRPPGTAAGQPPNPADRASLDAFARRYLTAFNTGDVPTIAALACQPPTESQQVTLRRTLRLARQTATLAGSPRVHGSTATVPVTLTSTVPAEVPRGQPPARKRLNEASSVTVSRRGRGWCIG